MDVYVELVQIHKQIKIQESRGVEDRHSTSSIPDGNQLATSQFYIYYVTFQLQPNHRAHRDVNNGCLAILPGALVFGLLVEKLRFFALAILLNPC
jgi:hypothetical protein